MADVITKKRINVTTDGYESIRYFFDNLNKEHYHFVNSNDESTPIGCVKEMVDAIPSSFWKRKHIKVLDPCAGNGNFHAYITNQKTHLNNLYFNEINSVRVKNIKRIFGNDVQVTLKDFLEFEDKEEYDLVVSNPPYAKFNAQGRTAKNHNLSRDFIKKAINVTKKGGYILFIVPDNWMSLADRNDIVKILSAYQFIHLNIHGAKKWFPKIGSSFSWFLVQKEPNKKEFVVENFYKVRSKEKVMLDTNTAFIPLYYSDVVRSIINKTLNAENEKYAIQTSSDLHKYTKKHLLSHEKTDIHTYETIHTPTQTVWSERPHKYQKGYKVFISLTNQYGIFIKNNCGSTQSIAFVQCKNKQEAEKISRELNNEVYYFLNNITRYGNFNNIRVLQKFPVYKDFKLTQQELEFIREFNEAYYRKDLSLSAKNGLVSLLG